MKKGPFHAKLARERQLFATTAMVLELRLSKRRSLERKTERKRKKERDRESKRKKERNKERKRERGEKEKEKREKERERVAWRGTAERKRARTKERREGPMSAGGLKVKVSLVSLHSADVQKSSHALFLSSTRLAPSLAAWHRRPAWHQSPGTVGPAELSHANRY